MGRDSDIAIDVKTMEACSKRLSVAGVAAGLGETGDAATLIGEWYVDVHRTVSELGHQYGVNSVAAATDLAIAAFERGLIYPGEETLQFLRGLSAKIWSAHPHNVRSVDRAAEQRF